ncbi:MAG: hypothetical protein V8S95_05880 [Odoribacter sp.]
MGKKAVENIERYGVEQIMEQWVDLFNDCNFLRTIKDEIRNTDLLPTDGERTNPF